MKLRRVIRLLKVPSTNCHPTQAMLGLVEAPGKETAATALPLIFIIFSKLEIGVWLLANGNIVSSTFGVGFTQAPSGRLRRNLIVFWRQI